MKFLDKLAFFFKVSGVDYKALRKILQVKFIMDQRRVPTIMHNNRKTESKNAFQFSLLIYGFIGLFIALLLVFPFPLFFQMNFIFGMIIFMVMATMISDFFAVLLDIKDKDILLSRPVNSRTINTAKLIHIVNYLFLITMSISGPPLIAGLLKYGLSFALLFFLELILICCLVVFLTSIIYFAVLSIFDGEKLKDIINYFQIVLSFFIIVGYQLIGRLFDLSRMTITIRPAWWNYFIPTAWFAAPFNLLIEHSFTQYYLSLSALAMLIPVLTLGLYILLVIPYFERKLQKLNNNYARKLKGTAIKEKLQGAGAHLVCFNKTEKAFYRFAQNILANERKLKLKLYPSLAFAVVMPFISIAGFLRSGKSLPEIMTEIANGKYYFALYLTAAFLAVSTTMLSNSEKYRGAWIYRVLPVASPVPILKGALKGFLVKFILPVYFFTGLLFVFLCGAKIIPDVILIFFNLLFLALLIFKFNNKELPFYKDFQYTQDGNKIGITLLAFFLCGISAIIHLFAKSFAYGVEINILVSLTLTTVFWFLSFRITWIDMLKGSL